MDYLARREHTQLELKRKLLQKGFDEEQTQSALVGLAEQGLQSDERFVQQFMHQRVTQGYGPCRIEMELVQRGVDQHWINVYLPEAEEYWLGCLKTLCQRKFTKADLRDKKSQAKAARFLLQRGFKSAHVQYVLTHNDFLETNENDNLDG